MGSVFGSKDGLRPSTSTPMTDSLTSSPRSSSAASTTNRRNRLPRWASAKVALPRIRWSCKRTRSGSMSGNLTTRFGTWRCWKRKTILSVSLANRKSTHNALWSASSPEIQASLAAISMSSRTLPKYFVADSGRALQPSHESLPIFIQEIHGDGAVSVIRLLLGFGADDEGCGDDEFAFEMLSCSSARVHGVAVLADKPFGVRAMHLFHEVVHELTNLRRRNASGCPCGVNRIADRLLSVDSVDAQAHELIDGQILHAARF